ncbi:hypothetical protein PENSPDRAFT_687896 [Peniophora sp. CONT]|nr:hypothetical protein PENSPDRAFT_687896 [Peniophora sp. CONT]
MSLTSDNSADTISYISRLNLDSLRALFELVADQERPHPAHTSVEKCWTKIGHVCRLWRSVLLNMPTLWARGLCAFGVHAAFDDLLVRAQDARLHLGFPPELPEYTLSRMAPLIPRAHMLRCTIRSPEDYQSITEALSSRYLPSSKTLSITFDAWSIGNEIAQGAIALAHECSIYHLRMSIIVIHPPLNGCLTWLAISLHELDITRRFSLDNIVAVLQHNRSIESVALLCAIHEGHTRHLPSVTLQVLTRLTIIEEQRASTSAFDLLNLLHAPSVEHLNIADESIDTASKTTKALECTLDACAGSPTLALDEFSLGVRRGSEDDIYTDIHLYRAWSIAISSDTDAPFRLGLYPGVRSELLPASIEMLLAALRHLSDAAILHRVVELLMYPCGTEADSTEYWNMVLPYFPVVSALLVEGTTDGLAALFNTLSHCKDEARVLPCLTRLTIEHVESFNGFPWSVHFEQMFRRRMATGSPIREVRLKNLPKPIRKAMTSHYKAVIEQMEHLAESIGVGMITQEWQDAEEIIGTAFEYQY